MSKKTSVLIVDDCPEYTGLLRYALEQIPSIEILDEAEDGVQGIYHILRFNPDVVLMDLEMPKLGGMDALQHIMIHRPTPIIIFSSLSEVASARAFDVLKNGAVDFVSKDALIDETESTQIEDVLLEKITAASMMRVPMRKAFSLSQVTDIAPKVAQEKVIFCEDCGNRMVVSVLEERLGVTCDRCGDILVLATDVNHTPTSLAVLIGDEGSFYNILSIVPELEEYPATAITCILDVSEQHLDKFTQYLNSISKIPVIRGAVGTLVESGNCYLFTRSEKLCLRPHSSLLKLQHIPQQVSEIDPADLMLASVAKVFKDKSLTVLLSGKKSAPVRGLDHMKKNGASIIAIDPKLCMYAQMASSITEKFSVRQLKDKEIVCEIQCLGEKLAEAV